MSRFTRRLSPGAASGEVIRCRSDDKFTSTSRGPLWRNHMSEAMNPQNPGIPMEDKHSARPMGQGSQASAMSWSGAAAAYPPGLVLFAGIMILLLGGFEAVW